MKAALFIVTFAVIIRLGYSINAPFLVEINAFQDFVIKYNKSYPDALATIKALLRFIEVYRKIQANNLLFNQGLVEHEMDINTFADWFPSNIQQFANGTVIPSAEFNQILRPKSLVYVTSTMFPPGPASIDWNARGKVTPVKDQGYVCNSCWAFSAIAALESQLAIRSGTLVSLSEQYLIDCNRNFMTGNWGCQGGSQASAYMNIQYSPGVPSMNKYPYQEDVQHSGIYRCRYNASTAEVVTNGYGRILPGNETLLRDVVASVGPVAFAMNAELDSFMYYSSGIYDDPACVPGVGHSALIYGYGTARYAGGRTVDYWLCKNSWSDQWGKGGHFKMVRGKNMCGLTSYLIYPTI